MNTAVLDIGKTNVKFAVFDPAGDLKFERQIANITLPGPPYRHVDVEKIWTFLGASLHEACGSLEVDTLVPTTHGATGAVIDDHGLVLPIMDYEFAGVQDISRRYGELRDGFEKSFSPDMPVGLNWARQLAWQKWYHSVAFAKATAILAYPQYWAWRLTGGRANDICSLGCHTDLWLPLENKPSSLANALGVSKLLAPVSPPWQAMGFIRPSVAAEFGLNSKIKVLCGIHDSNASLLPYLSAGETPLTVLSTGTWVVAMAIGHSLSNLRQDLDMLANIDAVGRPTACARFMGGREFSVIAGDCEAEVTIKNIEELIHAEVFAFPSFSPNGGPYATQTGEILGHCANENRSSLATLYSALMCNNILDNLGVVSGDIIIEGSFARNLPLAGLVAQLRPHQKISVAVDQAGTARGAAMLSHWPNTRQAPKLNLIAPIGIGQLSQYAARWLALIPKL